MMTLVSVCDPLPPPPPLVDDVTTVVTWFKRLKLLYKAVTLSASLTWLQGRPPSLSGSGSGGGGHIATR